MNFSQTGIDENAHFCYETPGSCPKIIYPLALLYTMYIFFVVASLLTICGNLLVIITISYFRHLHTPTNYLILSLAVADLLVGGIVMPPGMVRSLETCWYFGDFFCKFHASADFSLCNTSVLHLTLISVDRYYAVCQPLRYQNKITTSSTMIMIVAAWSLGTLFGFGMIFLELNIKGIEDWYFGSVVCDGGCYAVQSMTSCLVYTFGFFYIPMLVIFGFYTKIFLVAQKQVQSIHSMAHQNVNSQNKIISSNKMDQKATKTLTLIVGIFLVCWTPFYLTNFVASCIQYNIPSLLYEIFMWIGYLNSLFNPIIYVFFYSWFRTQIQKLFGKIFNHEAAAISLTVADFAGL
ncbi:trace amine-associated receptor 1-like [Megalops cyprinoides]|uniref:trace amine-associated receptor 1-like n=1 Tax=Megalops cyprinoides TaxID=118141 RepID=UPI001864F713|nr:trace amine-associated receptor 1-like [Megalops cyprinoides]